MSPATTPTALVNAPTALLRTKRRGDIPLRFALPAGLTCASSLTGVAGAYWDVGFHTLSGPGERTLITAPHMLVVVAIYGVVLAVLLHALMPGPRVPGERKLGERLSLAPGAILILVCGITGFMAFVLDDFWHRFLGSDPTIWGPTHLLLIVSSAFATIGAWSLLRQGQLLGRTARATGLADALVAGTLLVSLSLIQAEFDFGSPSFRLHFQPVVIAFCAGLAMVCARWLLGPGGALKALAFFLCFRAAIAVMVGPVLGEATPHFAIYIAEAIVVELAAVLIARSPLRFALASAFGIGILGTLEEYAWSHLWAEYPWPSSLLVEGLPLAVAAAIGGTLLGLRIGQVLGPSPDVRVSSRTLRWPALAAAGFAVVLAFGPLVPRDGPDGTTVSYDATPAVDGRAQVTVSMNPRGAAHGAEWLALVALGEDRRETTGLHEVSPGRYAANRPVSVGGKRSWELRLAQGSKLMSAPLHLRRPTARAVRLGRDTPGGLGNGDLVTAFAYAGALAMGLSWLALMVLGLRLSESSSVRIRGGPETEHPASPIEAGPLTSPT